jgi:hypothetical protein
MTKQEQILAAINQAGGKLFTISYKKKDGTYSSSTGRRGVVAHLRGGGAPVPEHLLTIYTFKGKGQYKRIIKENLIGFRCGKTVIV